MLALLLLLLRSSASASAGSARAPSIAVDPELSRSGYFRVSWDWAAAGEPRFELEETRGADVDGARIVYRGPDLASVVTGRADGTYHYRVRALATPAGASAWSERVAVRVRHHPLARALVFFAAGAVVFLATVGIVVAGTIAAGKEGEA